jgi:hypothetical protein
VDFDETTRRLIALAVRDRRAHLGLSQEEAAARSGGMISTANLRVVEGAGRPTYRAKSLIGVARAMAWPDDAIVRIAGGEDPRSLAVPGASPGSVPSSPADAEGAAARTGPTGAIPAGAVSAAGIELVTAAEVAALRREVADQRRLLDDLGRRMQQLLDADARRHRDDPSGS